MTTLQEIADSVIGRTRDVLEMTAKDGIPFTPVIMCYRGEEEVAVCTSRGDPNRDAALNIALMATAGFAADATALATDSYIAISLVNPKTGKEWRGHDMSTAADEDDAVAKGWISEALSVMVANRAGDALMISLPYRRIGKDGKYLRWREPKVLLDQGDDPSKQVGGSIPNALRRIMARPTLNTMMSTEIDSDWDTLAPDYRTNVTDVATVKMLAREAHAVVLMTAEMGTERCRHLMKSLGRDAVIKPWSDS